MSLENIQQMRFSGYENQARPLYFKEKSTSFCGHLANVISGAAVMAIGIGALVALSKLPREFYAGRECQDFGLYDKCWDVYCHYEKVCDFSNVFFTKCWPEEVCNHKFSGYFY